MVVAIRDVGKMSGRERTMFALRASEREATPKAIRWYELPMERRITEIRKALDQILWASLDWSNEVGEELAKLPEEERLDFATAAGRAIGHLGDYIADAVGGTR